MATQTVSPPLDTLISGFDRDANIYYFDLGGRLILFRVDGTVAELSESLFDLLSEREMPAADRIQRAESRHDSEQLAQLAADMEALRKQLGDPTLPPVLPYSPAGRRTGVLIMVTQTCNLACVYCYADAGTYGQPTKYQQHDNAYKAIDQLIAESGNALNLVVTFFGGEPFLRFDLIKDIVAYCKEAGGRVGKVFGYSVTTNGTLVTDEIAQFCRENNFNVMVSFDANKSFQDKLRPTADGHGSFDAARAGIQRLVAAGLAVSLRATVVKDMVREDIFREAIALTKSLGAKKIHLSSVDCTHVGHESLALGDAEVAEIGRFTRAITQEHIDGQTCEVPVYDPHASMIKALATGRAQGEGRCGACRGTTAVATNGALYPCHRFVGMDAYQIGDIHKGGLDASRVNQFFQAAMEAQEKACSVCFARLICGGLCFYSLSDAKGGFCAPDELKCNSIRANLLHSIEFLLQLRSDEGAAARYAALMQGNRSHMDEATSTPDV
jgi:uncharacterized protein